MNNKRLVLFNKYTLVNEYYTPFLRYNDGETVVFDHLFEDDEHFTPVDINNDGWVAGYVTDWSNLRRRVVVLKPKAQ